MAQPQANDWGKQWSQVVARAWTDAQFKKRLLADPAAVLKEHGLQAPGGLQVKVVENTDQVLHLTLPAKPSGEMSEADLDKVAGGIVIINNQPQVSGPGDALFCRKAGGDPG